MRVELSRKRMSHGSGRAGPRAQWMHRRRPGGTVLRRPLSPKSPLFSGWSFIRDIGCGTAGRIRGKISHAWKLSCRTVGTESDESASHMRESLVYRLEPKGIQSTVERIGEAEALVVD